MSKPNKINYLGTYIVRIENINVQRAEQYIEYLLNGDHDNHIDRTEIVNTIGEKDRYVVNNKLKILKNKENKRGKGGKPLKVSDKSLTFNIPKDYECSERDLIDIQTQLFNLIKNMYRENGVNVEEVDFFTNIHNQENKHINFAIPYLDQDGRSIPFIKSNRHFHKQLAKQFTWIVDNTLGTNIKTYMTEVDQMSKADEIMDNMATLELSEIEELKVKYKDNKLVKRALDYVYKIMNSTNNNKNIQRLLNTVEKIGNNGKLNEEEYEEFKKVMRKNGLLNALTEADRKKIKNSLK